MRERFGTWQQTFTGVQFWPCDPRPEEVCIEDIAHALSLQCRFAGHCREPYSVAQHSVLVASWIWGETNGDRIAALAGLLHDAAEAYCVDVPRPLKPFLEGYKNIEQGIAAAIAERFGLRADVFEHPIVKRADEVLLMTEKRDLLGPSPAPWTFAQGVDVKPLFKVIEPWSWRDAEERFLDRFAVLGGHLRDRYTVISKPGAAIHVEERVLSPEERAALDIGGLLRQGEP